MVERKPPAAPTDDAVVTLAIYDSVFQAQLARFRLDAAGIFSFVADEHMGALSGSRANAVGGIWLQVRKSEVGSAREVL